MRSPSISHGYSSAPRRPLAGIALAFAAGTATGLRWWIPLFALLTATGICLTLAIYVERRRQTWSAPVVFAALFLTGIAAATLRTAWPAAQMVGFSHLEPNATVELQIQITGDPTRYSTISDRPAWNVPASILAWREDSNGIWHKTSADLNARWRVTDFRPAPRYGDQWQIRGRFFNSSDRPPAAGPERFWAQQTERLRTDTGNAWIAHCFTWRRSAAHRLAAGMEPFPTHVAIVQALLLGLRQELTPELRQRFSATGTLHIMAISGLHVGVMTGIFVFALQTLGISRNAWFFFLAPLLITYTMATGARPSAVRACVMALAYWSALPMQRRPDAPSALALAALIILGFDPHQLTSPGFLFSFTVVAGLLVFFKPVHTLLMKPFRARIAYAPSVTPGLVRRELNRLANAALALATVSTIAWVMAAPLSAHYFGQISLIALPANLLVVPLALLIVITGCLALVTGAILPFTGIIFNYANLVWTGILLRVLTWFSASPGATMPLSFPALTIPAWYGILAIVGWWLHNDSSSTCNSCLNVLLSPLVRKELTKGHRIWRNS